ncbi:MAG: Na+/H+ antiporter NhaC family protein [Oscillospiraceae bacterium]|nr:Na+/H+ antiporter NhaC family protein [Oscillospiraceae bacterium]
MKAILNRGAADKSRLRDPGRQRGSRKGRPPKGLSAVWPAGTWVGGEHPPDCHFGGELSRRASTKLFLCASAVILPPGIAAFCIRKEDLLMFYGTIWSLLPPVIAIALALISKEVYSSLFLGIVAGALLIAEFSPVGALNTVVNDGLISGVADAWNAGIFLFLVMLGILVAMMNRAGGSAAFGRWAEKHVRTRVGAMLATFLLGVLIFVDDYFNCLTVGSVMRPVTDGHRISRAKLAYLIDATAAPICMIAPISSWAAAVSGIVDPEIMSGTQLFIRAIPWNYYSLLTLVFIIGLSLMKFDYGPMALHEKNAFERGDLFTTADRRNDDTELEVSPRGKVIDLILPVAVLIICCIIGMLYVGGYYDGTPFMEAFAGTDASVGLPWGSLIALIIAVIYFLCRRVLSFREAMDCIIKGFNAMVPALLILTFAVTLKNMTGMLGAADYVYGLMEGASAGLYNLLPAIIFLVACFLAFSTGTSWGTFGILIPIVTNVFPADSRLLVIGVSACLAGAVMGDHCSPISDTTIMASAGAQCNHLNHVSTQIPYVLTVAAVSFVSYIVAGLTQNVFVSLLVGIALTVGTLFVLRAKVGQKVA